MTRILFDAFDSGAAPVVPPSGPDGILLGPTGGVELEEGSVHRIEYRTDIHKARNGLERRARLLSLPRDWLEFEAVITDEDVFRDLRRRRAFSPTSVFLIAVPFEAQPTTTDVSGTSFSLDATYLDWLTPGQRVEIRSPAAVYDAVIQTAGAGPGIVSVTVDEAPPAGNFPAIATLVSPIRPFYLESPNPIGRWPVGAGRWSAVARGYSPRTTLGTGATIATLDGLNFIDRQPCVDGMGAEDRPEGGVAMHDYGAVILPEWSRTISDIFRSHTFRVNSTADRQYFTKLLDTMKGRQRTALLPTWRADFAPIPGSATGSQVDFADGGEYASAWFADTTHRRFWVTDSSGAVLFRTALTATVVSGNSRVTFNASVSANPPTAFMFLELVRLAADTTEFQYEAGCFGTVELRFLVVRQ